jgi:hypothetical protein
MAFEKEYCHKDAQKAQKASWWRGLTRLPGSHSMTTRL